MLDDAARTAQQAADALGIAVGQIAKSIIFRRKSDDCGGAGDHLGRPARRREEGRCDRRQDRPADAEFVKAQHRLSIGGVSPIAHASRR
jgi:prolyl-tRNA editing enzyme YbaK/EbsC (Cys-tRNA(Pro) deacylase)